MDVNYSRWMSKDPDAEPEVIEDEPRRFSFPRPAGSVLANGVLVAVLAWGGVALVHSIATPKGSADQAQTYESPTVEESAGPGAASVDDSTSDDFTSHDTTSDSSVSDDSTTSDLSAPAGPPPGPRRMERREFGPAGEMPLRPPMRERRELRPGFEAIPYTG